MLQCQAAVKVPGSFRPVAGSEHLYSHCNFAESLVETVPESLRHSCRSELHRFPRVSSRDRLCLHLAQLIDDRPLGVHDLNRVLLAGRAMHLLLHCQIPDTFRMVPHSERVDRLVKYLAPTFVLAA